MLVTPQIPRRSASAAPASLFGRLSLALVAMVQALPLPEAWHDHLERRRGPLIDWRRLGRQLRALLWAICVAGTDLPDLSSDHIGALRLRRQPWRGPASELTARVQAYQRRMRWQRALAIGCRGASVAIFVLALGAVLHITHGFAEDSFGLAPLAAALFVAGIALALADHVSLPEAARIADRKLEARARIATALELAERGAEGSLVEAQYQQTVARIRRFEPYNVSNLRPPIADIQLVALFGLAFVTALLLNNAGFSLMPRPDQHLQQVVDEEIKKLQTLERQLTSPNNRNANDPQTQAARQEVAQAVGKLARDLQTMKGSPQDALARLSAAEQELMERAQQLNVSDAALERLADSLSDLSVTRNAAEAMRSGRMDQAAQSLNSLAGELDKLSEQSRNDLVGRLRDAAQQMGRQNGGMKDAAQRAASALQDKNRAEAAQALKDLAQAVQQQGKAAAQQEALGRGISQIQDTERSIRSAMGGENPEEEFNPGQGSSGMSDENRSDLNFDFESMAGMGSGAGEGHQEFGDFGDFGYGMDREDDLDRPRRGEEKGIGAEGSEPPVDLSSLGLGGRLNADGKSIEVDVPPGGEGSGGSGRFSLVPADVSNGTVSVSGGPGNSDAGPITTSGDLNNVPWRLRNYVRDYFSQLSGR